MRGGLLGSKTGFVVAALALGACQSIIGISGYEIDEKLDDETGGTDAQGGTKSGGGTKSDGGRNPAAAGEDDVGEGGEQPSGGSETGGSQTGGSPSTVAGAPPVGGEGGGGNGGCTDELDCDDDIDCTVDTCNASGECEHEADTSLCVATIDECVTCQLAIGCVVGESVVQELLLDASFDAQTDDWVEYSDNFENNIFVEAGAQSGTRIAKFGPAPNNAAEEEYADLLQYVTIPDNTVSLSLSGYYRLTPGLKKPAGDYVVAAFYEIGGLDPYTQFHSWAGNSGAKGVWTAFTYEAPRAELLLMWGEEYTFDFVAHTFESVYRFDTLSMKATVCQ